MRLKSIYLDQFRRYDKPVTIPLSESITGLVGKNDAGKSTILEALEIFFNNTTVKIEPDDLNVNSSNNFIWIGCIFDKLPDEIIVDENIPTSFEEEYLVNENGDLQILKKYKVTKSVGKPTVYLNVNHPTVEKADDLHSLKISELKKRGKSIGVEDDVSDQRVSSYWRKAIWNKFDDLNLSETLIDVSQMGTESKGIYDKIEALMPTFALFQSDRSSTDDDPEAKNPMQAAVNQALKEHEMEIKKIQKEIRSKVEDVAVRTLEKLKEMNEELANELKPKFKKDPKWSFSFTIDSDDGVPLNKRGSGVRRLILLNFFRAEAEKKGKEEGMARIIYGIEEPETSQHPEHQLILMDALLELADKDNCQIILTTHVPALAGTLPIDGLRYITDDDEGHIDVRVGDEDVLKIISDSLGVLPAKEIAGAKAIVMVEGHSDVIFLNHASEKFKEHESLSHTLREKEIYAIPTGGSDNLRQWITRKTAEDLGLEWAVMLDSDIGNAQAYKRNQKIVRTAEYYEKKAYLLKKREIENYIHPDIVNQKIDDVINYSSTDNAKHIIARAAGVKESKVIEIFWMEMEADQILEMDRYKEEGEERHELLEIMSDFLTIVD